MRFYLSIWGARQGIMCKSSLPPGTQICDHTFHFCGDYPTQVFQSPEYPLILDALRSTSSAQLSVLTALRMVPTVATPFLPRIVAVGHSMYSVASAGCQRGGGTVRG